eukprot:m.34290 g.34290  ORF g.34290 m.34290 type:complete len:623 (+) comp16957_c0_seq1:155-2023(+)
MAAAGSDPNFPAKQKHQTWKIGAGTGSGGNGSRNRGRGRGGGRGGRGGSSRGRGSFGKLSAKADRDGDTSMGESSGTRKFATSRGSGGGQSGGGGGGNTSKSRLKVKGKKKKNRATKFADEITMEIERDNISTNSLLAGRLGKMRSKKKEKKAPAKPLPKEALKALEQTMGTRWNANDRSLNLTGLLNDPAMSNYAVIRGWDNPAFCNAVVKIVEANCATVVTLNLAGNELTSLTGIRRLATVAQDILNLDLSNNKLRVPADLGFFKGMDTLQRLRTNDNANRFYKTTPPLAKDKVLFERAVRKSFPNLTELDGSPLTSALPVAILGNYLPNPQIGQIVSTLLLKYFACLDEPGRPNITHLFTPKSIFSLTTPTNRGERASRLPDAYLKLTRNLRKSKISNSDNLNKRVICGAAILQTLRGLPPTVHDTTKLTVDVWMATAALVCLNVSGKFKDQVEHTVGSGKTVETDRCFHRVLMLVPAAANTPAAAVGWPATIVNEQLHISPVVKTNTPKSASRLLAVANASATKSIASPHTPHARHTPTMAPHSNHNHNPLVSPTPVAVTSPQVDQAQLLKKFMEVTKMNQQFSIDCLSSNQWNGNAALANWQELVAKGMIPPQAYVQ